MHEVEQIAVLFFQAEDGIRDLVRSRGLGDVYKRQGRQHDGGAVAGGRRHARQNPQRALAGHPDGQHDGCLLYTSDAADERSSVDLGGRCIIKKKKTNKQVYPFRMSFNTISDFISVSYTIFSIHTIYV